MKTAIYWTVIHGRHAAEELCFRATCWWLSRQMELFKWRLCLEGLMAHTDTKIPSLGRMDSRWTGTETSLAQDQAGSA